MKRTRMVFLPVFAAAGLALAACDDSAPVEHRAAASAPTISRPGDPVRASLPKAVELTKPPVLGPVMPALVLLPEHMAPPDIRVRLTDEADRAPAIPAGKYRGRVETFRLADGQYVAINTLPLDDYVQGVLSREILASWDAEAYRAQAIAARTFALFQMSTDGRGKLWDVNADTTSQVYGGIAAETAKARAAVAATRGQVLMATVDGKTGIFCSFYSSCIGGASQDPFDAWGDPSIGPLAAHVTGNIDENSGRYKWDRDFVISRADVTRCVRQWGARNGFDYLQKLGTIETVVINKRNVTTGRPTELMLVDVGGNSAPIRAEEFRLALMNDPLGRAPKPYSSNCDIRSEGNTIVLFNGHGYGHGIGMSQWGAQNMATHGYSHAQILAYFYPGSTIADLW